MQIFKLSVRRAASGWTIGATHQGGAGAPVIVEAPLDLDLQTLRAEASPLGYGQLLGEALFASAKLQNAFTRARSSAGRRLHLLLEVDADELRPLHWERLAVPLGDGRWTPAALDQRLCFALFVPSAVDRPLPPLNRAAARTLLLVASPAGLEQFGLQPFEAAPVASALLGALRPRRCTLLANLPGAAGPPSLAQLGIHLTERPCTVLHLVCHGRLSSEGEPVLYLADAQGQVDPVPLSRLAAQLDLIGDNEHRPRLVYLMSCASAHPEAEAALGGAAQQLVNRIGMPAVVAMTERVSSATATELARRFYQRLRQHGQPDRALVEARAALAERPDVGVATLYTRLEGQALLQPEPSPWPRLLATLAGALATLLALLVLLYVYAFEPALGFAVDALEWTVPAPPPRLPAVPELLFQQNENCAPSGELRRTLVAALGGRPHTLASGGAPGANTRLELSWSCSGSPEAPLLMRVGLPGPPALPLALLGEPTALSLHADVAQARAVSRAVALYALGDYPAALEALGSYGQQPAAEQVELHWLRAVLLLRAERWDEAQTLFAEAAALAEPPLAARLRANQAVASLYAREALGIRTDNPFDCTKGGRAALEQAQASGALSEQLQLELDLVAGWLLTLCPASDQEFLELAPIALSRAESQMLASDSLHAIADSLRADNNRGQDLTDDLLQGRVEEAALRALGVAPNFARPYRTLGRLYADSGQLDKARACFAAYAKRAPLRYQRREALELGLRTWKWARSLLVARPDLRACPS